MAHDHSPNSAPYLELALLRWLCVSAALDDSRKLALSALPGYKWHNADHAIVFEALKRLPAGDKRPLREQLPAIATRMGFPDITWEDYFVVNAPVSEEEIFEILRKLADSAAR